MFDILKTLVYGIVQGITEWLPISSTGHMLLVNQFLSLEPFADEISNTEFFNLFLVVIQFGSILAVVVLFFNKLWPFQKDKTARDNAIRIWIKVIIGMIPTMIVGLLLDDIVDEYLHGPIVIAIALIVYGIVFFFVDEKNSKKKIKTINQLPIKTAVLIGCFQCLALIPGTSRSGATILGGLLLGCSRAVASEFSFFIAIPVMAGASLLKLIKAKIAFNFMSVLLITEGTFISFIVSLFAIKFLMNYVRTHSFKLFGVYRIVLGVIIIAVSIIFA